MFGNNPIRKKEHDTRDGSVWVQEIFHTIQGEGPLSGTPAVFVRLAGCNLACYWCDTEFESAFANPDNCMSISHIMDLIEEVRPATTRLIVLTGGEPMRQMITPLARRITGYGLQLQLETAGTVCPPGFPPRTRAKVHVVCSPKTGKVHGAMQDMVTAWKYVVADDDAYDKRDGLPLASTQVPGKSIHLARPTNDAPVYLSPRDDQDPVENSANLLAAAERCLEYGYILTTQLHKDIGLR